MNSPTPSSTLRFMPLPPSSALRPRRVRLDYPFLDLAVDEPAHGGVARRPGSPRACRPRGSARRGAWRRGAAIWKISGISWLTMTAVKPNFRWSPTIRWWIELTRIGIEPGRRLVEEHDLGLGHQGPRDGDALAHAAGDLGRVLVAHLRQPHLGERLLRARQEVGRRRPAGARGSGTARSRARSASRRGRRPGTRRRSAPGPRRGPGRGGPPRPGRRSPRARRPAGPAPAGAGAGPTCRRPSAR